MALKSNSKFMFLLLILVFFCAGCEGINPSTIKSTEFTATFDKETYLPLQTSETGEQLTNIVISNEFPIADRVTNQIYRNDILYFQKDSNTDNWYEFNFETKQVNLSENEIYTNEQLIEMIKRTTKREPSLSDFFPSPSYRKVLFAELQNPIEETQGSPDSTPSLTLTPSNPIEWDVVEAPRITDPQVYLLYVYDVDSHKVIKLGRFSGDIGQVFWTADENKIIINRASMLVYDYLSPFGNWIVDINTGAITEIAVKNEIGAEILPVLISNDGILFIYKNLSVNTEPGLYIANLQTGEVAFLPISPINRCWWLINGKSFAFISTKNEEGFPKILGYDLERREEIPSVNNYISANLFSSAITISNEGNYIVYTHEGDTMLYGREIILTP